MSDGKKISLSLRKKAFLVKQLTLVHGAILEDELVDELEALLLRRRLQISQQLVLREVELGRPRYSVRRLSVLDPAVTVVPIVASEPFLFRKGKKLVNSSQRPHVQSVSWTIALWLERWLYHALNSSVTYWIGSDLLLLVSFVSTAASLAHVLVIALFFYSYNS